ncbi:hypothetical protein DV706_14155 [Natronorubrum bangense]|nr:hypothetical protein DV706_14155 [Natronorubrum bangense]
MRDASWQIVERGEDVATDRIVQRDAIWQWDLIGSFQTNSKKDPRGRIAILANTSDHAAPLEHGAQYGARGPPLAPLILYLMTKFGTSGFGGSPKLRPGPGGGTGTQSADVPEGYRIFNQDSLKGDFDEFFYGQKLRVLDLESSAFSNGIVRGKFDSHLLIEVDGQLVEVPWDGSSSWRLLGGQLWDDLAPADQMDLIRSLFDQVNRGPGMDAPYGLAYEQLPQADLDAIDDTYLKFVDANKNPRSVMRATERLRQIGQLPSDRSENAHILEAGPPQLDGDDYFGTQPFVEQGGLYYERNRHLDVWNHELMHLWINAQGYDYSSDKDHSQLGTYRRGNLLEWTVNPDGFTDDYQLHRDPELFMLYSHDNRTTPIEWDHIVETVPDYVDGLDPTPGSEIVDQPGPEVFDPSNPQVREGDQIDIMFDDAVFPTTYEFTNDQPFQVGPDEWQYEVRDTEVNNPDFFSVDSEGNPVGATVDVWERVGGSASFEGPLDGQQYLTTDMQSNPRLAYAEALNRTLYTHIYARSQEYGTGNEDLGWYTALYDGYGMTNTHETAAVMTQIMRTQVSEAGDRRYVADNIERIATVHPYLMETWLNLFEPSDLAKAELDRMGINY